MTPVRSIKNQYQGINAHLHSLWQAEGGWDAFHNNHITYLTAALKAQLLPMGYTAENQQSLQYDAIAIYEFVSGQSSHGEPVAWVELLSPSNKPGGQDAAYYRSKRLKLLHSGIVFIELDYLHESPPTFDRIPRYVGIHKSAVPEADAHPYRIMVIDPRPEFVEGVAAHAPFDVDVPIPSMNIPLNRSDVLAFDFNAPYQKTYQELLYGLELVDYSQLPTNFDRYSHDDQIRIVARMIAILKATRDGLNLDSAAPFPTEAITLSEGLSRLQGN